MQEGGITNNRVMSLAVCLLMITSISAPISQNVWEPQTNGQPQKVLQSGPNPTSGETGGLADSPWPTFGQNNGRTGLSPYDTSSNPGKLKWIFDKSLNLLSSSVAIDSNGTIYHLSMNDKMYAINPDGTEKWNFSFQVSFSSTPTIGSDGTIYLVSSTENKLYAVNPDGTLKWNFTAGEKTLSSTWFIVSPAIGSDGTIYFSGFDKKLYAINQDGTQKWNLTVLGPSCSSPTIDSNGTIYIGSKDNKLYAINPDGTQKWNITIGKFTHSPSIGSDGTIYIQTGGGSHSPDTLWAIDVNGNEKWNVSIMTFSTNVALDSKDTIYVGDTGGYLYAINSSQGAIIWKFRTSGGIRGKQPSIGSDGTIYIGTGDFINPIGNKLYAINPDGTEKWSFTGAKQFNSAPAIGSDGTIYISSFYGPLYAIGNTSLDVNVTSHFTNLNSAAQSKITVKVTQGTFPISGATVNLVSDNGGLFSPQSGITDVNGDFKSIFNAPTVTVGTTCSITADVTKSGYNEGLDFVDIKLNPIPWPKFHHNIGNTAQSPYDTVSNPGKLKWRFLTNAYIYSPPSISSDGTIYVGSYDNKLYAINPDGSERWNYVTGDSIGSSPTIGSDGTIYIASYDDHLYALNPNGTEKWSFKTSEDIRSSPVIGSDGTIYVGSQDNKLYAINPDGSEKWNFYTGNSVHSSPIIGSDGTIYFGSLDRNLYAINPDGSQRWSFTTGDNIWSSPAIGSDGTIYVGSYDDRLYAINPDGSEKWNFKTNGNVFSSPAISSVGTIYVGSNDGTMYAVNPDGTQNWKFTADPWVISSPAIGSDGTIYFGSGDNYCYAINPDGSERWRYETADAILSSPAIGSDGTIYIGSRDYYLHAIGEGLVPPNTDIFADAGIDQFVNEGETVQFDGSKSTGSGIGTWDPHLVALYHMNTGYGDVLFDSTPYQNHGTLIGPNWTSDGKWGNGLSFDGVDDYVEIRPNDKIFGDNPDEWSCFVWFKSSNDKENMCLISDIRSYYTNSIDLTIEDNGKSVRQVLQYFGGTGGERYSIGGKWGNYANGDWNFVAATFSKIDEEIYLYVNNGAPGHDIHHPEGHDYFTGETLRIGARDPLNYEHRIPPNSIKLITPFDGSIDEIAFFNRILSEEEIRGDYENGKEYMSGNYFEIVSYEWDFESDGIYDYKETPTNAPDGTFDGINIYRYGDNGEFNVTLRVTDENGEQATDTCRITVLNAAPTIEPFDPLILNEGLPFDITTTSSDPGSDDLTFLWEFEDGPTMSNTHHNDGTNPDPFPSPLGIYPFSATDTVGHVFGDDGNYSIVLTVTDDDGGSAVYETYVLVNNVPPSITSMNYSIVLINEPRTIGYWGHQCDVEEPYGDHTGILQEWVDEISSESQVFSWISTKEDVCSVVQDGDASDMIVMAKRQLVGVWLNIVSGKLHLETEIDMPSLTISKTVWDAVLEIEDVILNSNNRTELERVKNIADNINNGNGIALAIVEFTASATDPGADDLIFHWEFGDGKSQENFYPNPGGVFPTAVSDNVIHSYFSLGTFTVTLTVSDDDGGTAMATFEITLPG